MVHLQQVEVAERYHQLVVEVEHLASTAARMSSSQQEAVEEVRRIHSDRIPVGMLHTHNLAEVVEVLVDAKVQHFLQEERNRRMHPDLVLVPKGQEQRRPDRTLLVLVGREPREQGLNRHPVLDDPKDFSELLHNLDRSHLGCFQDSQQVLLRWMDSRTVLA